jgi:hypothetical protein
VFNGGTVTGSTGITSTISSGAGTNATGSINWMQSPLISNNGQPIMSIPPGEQTLVLEETATLQIKGVVKINGVDLEERLSTIETLLQIPTRDATMEATHPKLAKLYKEYMKELEKYKTWHRLTGD